MNPTPPLTLIEGGRSDRLLQRLRQAPEAFDEDEFDQLLDRFSDQLSRAEAYDLAVERLRRLPCDSEIEKQAVLAAALGDTVTLKRLEAILVRRNMLGLKVISS